MHCGWSEEMPEEEEKKIAEIIGLAVHYISNKRRY
jgi:hypothetical protein